MRSAMRNVVLAVLLIIFSSVANGVTSVDPMGLGVGARSLAMGRTNAAAPGDINAIFVNPANAAYLTNWGITSMSTSLLEGEMNYTLLGGAMKSFNGGAGIAYLGGVASGITETTRDANSRVAGTGNSFDYSNSTITLAYGKEIKDNLSAGGSLKVFSKGFSGQSSGTGFNFDLGLLYKLGNSLNLGLTAQNILPSISPINWGTGAKEDAAMGLKGGMNYLIRDGLQLNTDLDLLPFAVHSGVEWTPLAMLALRGGFENVSTGNSSVLNLGAGVGLKFSGLNFDYAYYKDGALEANSTHFFTLSFVPDAAKSKISNEAVAVKKTSPAEEYKNKILQQSTGEVTTILTPKPKAPPKTPAKKAVKKPVKKIKPAVKKK